MATRTVPQGTHVQNGSLSAAVTISKPANANGCLISCTGQNVRYTLDGSTVPTATIGFQLVKDQVPLLVEPGSSIRVIEMAASGALSLQWVFAEDELMHHA